MHRPARIDAKTEQAEDSGVHFAGRAVESETQTETGTGQSSNSTTHTSSADEKLPRPVPLVLLLLLLLLLLLPCGHCDGCAPHLDAIYKPFRPYTYTQGCQATDSALLP